VVYIKAYGEFHENSFAFFVIIAEMFEILDGRFAVFAAMPV
jgi:hypothetical protein